MFGFGSKQYQILQSPSEEEVNEVKWTKTRTESRLRILMAVNTAIFSLSLAILYISMNLATKTQPSDSAKVPNILQLEIPISSVQVEGDFGDDDNYKTSIYRQPPGPEVDAAWARVANSEMIGISTADVITFGKNPDTTVRAPEDWGLGPDVHLGVLDVFHQVHCLNALRRGIYYEHYFAPAMGEKKTDMFYSHMGHCMSILLQNIMCAASLDVITHNWVKGHRLPVPDFSIQHQCRDIEAVIRWQEENSIDYSLWSKMKAPKGATKLEPSEALLEAFKIIASHKHKNGTIPF